MSGARRATVGDIPEVAAMLARAFAHDPFYAFIAGDAPERNQRMRDGWTGFLHHASNGLSHTYTTDEHAGVAVWYPPGYTGAGFIDSLRLLPSAARMAGGIGRLRDVSRAVAALEQHRRLHAAGPHFYLAVLGVEPERQGEGIGSALMQPVLDLASGASLPAYLETATGRNVLLYERAGFVVVEELIIPGTDIHGWLMLRA